MQRSGRVCNTDAKRNFEAKWFGKASFGLSHGNDILPWLKSQAWTKLIYLTGAGVSPAPSSEMFLFESALNKAQG
ncbi:MAG: hypothetical protein AUF67_12290 [Acidobacteria bacterium 13_1_20CM_58_21]|nr:MAG: hypothetical protein AUF67_12290 [Acidobacteria bacterium 13_1_20CM_58_21]